MIRFFSFTIAVLIYSVTTAQSIFTPGTYAGEAQGRRDKNHSGQITVFVTLTGDKIENIDITEFNQSTEHKKYGKHVKEAKEKIPEQIIGMQTLRVDAVSKATATSNAIRLAVARAVMKGTNGKFEPGKYRIGETSWSNKKYTGKIDFEIFLSGSMIDSIKIITFDQDINHDKYGPAAQNASKVIPQKIIAEQSLEVDAISMATMSSNSIILGVAEAVLESLKSYSKDK